MSFNHVNKQLPRLRSLQVFEVAARCESFTSAAEELRLTQSAVSRQVQELERWLGIKLFVRSGPHLKVTETGKSLAESVAQAMSLLKEAIKLVGPNNTQSRRITLSMLPSVATKWLAPRLGRFILSHPEIDIRIAASREMVNFEADEVDAAIRYGAGDWENLNAELLAEETVTPVCSPTYAKQIGLVTPADLLNATLLQTDIKEDWVAWFKAAGLQLTSVPRGPHLGDDAATLQAVIEDQGVALGRSVLIDDDIRAGKLITPFQQQLNASYSYWFVTPLNRVFNTNLLAVHDWLKDAFDEKPFESKTP